jgi:GNAT superfamily N-acetyltransferase
MTKLTIREGRLGDEDLVCKLLYELAEYEKLTGMFRLTAEIVARDFLGPDRVCRCDLAFLGEEPVGVMTWYPTYGSFSTARGIYLEDLFVRPSQRGKGFGKTMLAHLARRAAASPGGRIDWTVLDWNAPSIAFYEGLRAHQHKGWLSYRLEGDALEDLADQA